MEALYNEIRRLENLLEAKELEIQKLKREMPKGNTVDGDEESSDASTNQFKKRACLESDSDSSSVTNCRLKKKRILESDSDDHSSFSAGERLNDARGELPLSDDDRSTIDDCMTNQKYDVNVIEFMQKLSDEMKVGFEAIHQPIDAVNRRVNQTENEPILNSVGLCSKYLLGLMYLAWTNSSEKQVEGIGGNMLREMKEACGRIIECGPGLKREGVFDERAIDVNDLGNAVYLEEQLQKEIDLRTTQTLPE